MNTHAASCSLEQKDVVKLYTLQYSTEARETTRDPPHLPSGRIGCRKHGLSFAQLRVLLQLRMPLGRSLIIPPQTFLRSAENRTDKKRAVRHAPGGLQVRRWLFRVVWRCHGPSFRSRALGSPAEKGIDDIEQEHEGVRDGRTAKGCRQGCWFAAHAPHFSRPTTLLLPR
jgi:hypothetical protein